MTDPIPCADINADLARAKGYKSRPGMMGLQWQNPEGEEIGMTPPNFCGSWEHAGPLLEELLEWHGRMEFGHEFFMVHVAKYGKHNGKSLTEAIARAAHAMLEEKK